MRPRSSCVRPCPPRSGPPRTPPTGRDWPRRCRYPLRPGAADNDRRVRSRRRRAGPDRRGGMHREGHGQRVVQEHRPQLRGTQPWCDGERVVDARVGVDDGRARSAAFDHFRSSRGTPARAGPPRCVAPRRGGDRSRIACVRPGPEIRQAPCFPRSTSFLVRSTTARPDGGRRARPVRGGTAPRLVRRASVGWPVSTAASFSATAPCQEQMACPVR